MLNSPSHENKTSRSALKKRCKIITFLFNSQIMTKKTNKNKVISCKYSYFYLLLQR